MIEDVAIPDGLWQKLNRQTTLVHWVSAPILHIRPYDAIFFSQIDDTISYSDVVYKILQSVYKAGYSVKEHKEITQELRVATAGMVWSKIDEDTQNGSVYWYDPIAHQGDHLSDRQLSDLFQWLSQHFTRE